MAHDLSLPDFDDLPVLGELGLRHAWGVFGEEDDLGTVNLLTPERVAAGAALVRTGEVEPCATGQHLEGAFFRVAETVRL